MRVKIGISACLLGEKVRYDGRHKFDPFLADALGEIVDWVPVCPEVEAGFGVPRDTLRLEGDPADPRLVFTGSRLDVTSKMQETACRMCRNLESIGVRGFVLKCRSPSCGLAGVEVVDCGGDDPGRGRGIFAAVLSRRFPRLPITDDERLRNREAMEEFIERIAPGE